MGPPKKETMYKSDTAFTQGGEGVKKTKNVCRRHKCLAPKYEFGAQQVGSVTRLKKQFFVESKLMVRFYFTTGRHEFKEQVERPSDIVTMLWEGNKFQKFAKCHYILKYREV